MGEIEEWIRQQLSNGTTPEQIKQLLANSGYPSSVYETVDSLQFQRLSANQAPEKEILSISQKFPKKLLIAVLAIAIIAFVLIGVTSALLMKPLPEKAVVVQAPEMPEEKVYTLEEKKLFLTQYTHIEHYEGVLAGVDGNTFILEKNGTRINVEATTDVRVINRKENRLMDVSELEIGTEVGIYTESNAEGARAFNIILVKDKSKL